MQGIIKRSGCLEINTDDHLHAHDKNKYGHIFQTHDGKLIVQNGKESNVWFVPVETGK